MAKLIEALRSNESRNTAPNLIKGQSGQLTQVSEKGLQAKADALGMPIAPTTPLSAAQVGANPDQAKMAGTPNQMNSAIRQSAARQQQGSPEVRLDDAQRLDAPRTESTLEEAARAATTKAMEGIGTLGNRVNEAVAQRLNSLYSSQASLTINAEAATEAGIEDTSALTDHLATLLADDTTPEEKTAALNEINRLHGFTSVEDGWKSPEEFLQYFSTSEQGQLSDQVRSVLGSSVRLSDLQDGLGMSNADLAAILGVDEEIIQELTVQEFQELIDSQLANMTGEIDSIHWRLSDPNVSAREKAELRSRLRDLGATGQRSVEVELNDLREALDRGDEVEFNGKRVSLDELLSDEYMSTVIGDYLMNPERSSLAEEEPSLVDWIETNREGLMAALDSLQSDLEKYDEMQTSKKNLNKIDAGALSDDIMNSLMGEGWNLLSTQLGPIPPILTLAKQDGNVAAALQSLEDDLEAVEQLKELSTEELESLGMGMTGSKWDLWIKSRQLVKEIEGKELDEAMHLIFGNGWNRKKVDESLNDQKYLRALGVKVPASMLDSDGDGKIDPISSLVQNIHGIKQAGMSLKDVVGTDLIEPKSGMELTMPSYPANMSKADQAMYTKLLGVSKGDGKPGISDSELRKAVNTVSAAELDRAAQLGLVSKGQVAQMKRNVQELISPPSTANMTSDIIKAVNAKASSTDMRPFYALIDSERGDYVIDSLRYSLESLISAAGKPAGKGATGDWEKEAINTSLANITGMKQYYEALISSMEAEANSYRAASNSQNGYKGIKGNAAREKGNALLEQAQQLQQLLNQAMSLGARK